MNSVPTIADQEDGITPNQDIDISHLIRKYLYHWPVFIVGLILCLSVAFLYLRYAKPLYQVTSTLLIKDQKKSGGQQGDLLNELDLFGGSKVVENEIEILQSKDLMEQVVRRLNLTVSYISEGRVITSDLYDNRPVNFSVVKINSHLYGHTFTLSFKGVNEYILKDVASEKIEKGLLNTVQNNSIGDYLIEKKQGEKIDTSVSYTIKINDPKQIVDDCLSNLSVTLKSKAATVIQITYQTYNIEKGKDILNTLVQVYNEASLEDKNQTTQSTLQFIDKRLQLISGELTAVEKDVETFKSSQGLTDISSEATAYLQNVQVNDAKRNEIDIQIRVLDDIRKFVNSNSAYEKLPSVLGISDPVLLGQITQLSQLQLQRDQLLATTQADNPTVVPILKQIETTRVGIQTNLKNIYKALESTKKSLLQNGNKYEKSIKQVPQQEREYISIKRQQSIKESLYLYLLQKKEEAALTYAAAVADSRVIDSAFSTNIPIQPNKQKVELLALIIGLCLPLGYLSARDMLNSKIRSLNDVSAITKAPVLGEIMFEEGKDSIVVSETSRRAIAEQFRSIRTNMQFVFNRKKKNEGQVTLLTSSMSGEGKSFVASNIAMAFSLTGRKTVLIELDLRKPKVSQYLNQSNKIGISNYLIGKATIEDIITKTSINPNLFLIGSGPIPPNPSELLIETEMEDLFSYLRANFDEIIVDTPPIGLVTDALILARLADVSIYLIRQGITEKVQVSQMNKLYQSSKFPRLNIVLNGVQVGGIYGYGYGYGYGYYSDDIQHSKLKFSTLKKEFLKRF